MSRNLHQHTPSLFAIDPRGLSVVAVAYHRLDADADPEARIERQAFDAGGRLICQWDARLWADGGEASGANQCTVYSLSDQVLSTNSVDAGWRASLFGEAGQDLEGWNGRGVHRQTAYDNQLRLVSVHEQMIGEPERCVERFAYGDSTETATNRCGRLLRHDDPAGSRTFAAYGLMEQGLAQVQRFLSELDTPNWPALEPAREALLETDDQGVSVSYTTRWAYDALGALLNQVDAVGNEQITDYDVAGQLRRTSLRASDDIDAMVLVHKLDYNPLGVVTAQTAGNGVTTTASYCAVDGRLQRLRASRPDRVLQELEYSYDPVGNLLSVKDSAQPTDWFNGQQVDPLSRYCYDTLYQLIEAAGRESVHAGIQPGLPGLGGAGGTGDASRLRNYTQTYAYDASGNLVTSGHSQAATRTMRVAERSNRSLFMADADNPPDLSRGFDANGNLLQLEGVQVMSWDARNQLQRVTQVQRADGSNDDEVYVYGGDGQRRRKVRVQQAKALIHVAETRYLPGLEIRTNTAKREVLHVATVQAGRCNVRRLYWHQSRNALPNPQLRYSLDDQRESSVLELDGGADVISHEGYYPYGGTAWWAARSQAEADYKTVRYSGKERDATGLYYYGFRYYAPWLQRWINPDPAGDVDGLNVYLMVKCNPITLIDNTGLLSEAAQEVRSKIDRHKKILSVITSRTIDIERTIQNHESWISRLLEAGGRVANILTKGFIRGAGGAVGAALGGVAGAIVGGALGALIGTSLGKKQIAKRAGKYFNNIMKAHGIQPRRINLTGNELDPDHVIVSALSKDKSSKTPDKIFKKITKKIIAPLGGKLVKTLGVDVLSLPEEYWAASHKITDDKLIAIDADISVLSGIVKARVVDLNKEINALGDDASSLSVDKQNLSEESQLLLQTLVTTKEVIGAYRISSLPHNLR